MRSLLLLAILMVTMTACGKRGALYYPDMLLPAAPAITSAVQSGSSVKLQFVLPDKDRAGRKLSDLAGVKINRRVSDSTQEQACSSCMSDYRLFLKLNLDLLPENVQRYGTHIVVIDGDVNVGKAYSYSVVPFTRNNFDGLASPQVSIRPVQPTLPPVIYAESFPTEIRISFVRPQAAGSFIGYNLYRTTQLNVRSYLPVNREPLRGNEYIDSGLDRNRGYYYMARTLVKLESGAVVESPVSNVVEGMLKNDE